jgi:UPF0271 protein
LFCTRLRSSSFGAAGYGKLVGAMRVDLNADIGESFGPYTIGDDAELLRSVTSASVAAGFHGGDPTVLRHTIRLAKERGVRVGAHPGLPDLAGFGRRPMRLTPEEAEDMVLYQVAAVAGVASAEGVRLQHVKPHGALYNMAARDHELASAIARAVTAIDPSLMLFGPPASELAKAARSAGLQFVAEGFADRAYQPDGSLVPRGVSGAVIDDASRIVSRAVTLIKDRRCVAIDGTILPLAVDTLCLHGDTPGAGRLAAALRAGLEHAGIRIGRVRLPPSRA